MPSSTPYTPRLKVLAVASLVVSGLAYLALRDDEGLRHVFRERSRLQDLAHSVSQVRAENDQLRVEIKALREDPRAVERVAREQLGLSRGDEIVFILEEEPPPVPR